jgi:RNA polymerase sigma-70 factor, ECF subfamily
VDAFLFMSARFFSRNAAMVGSHPHAQDVFPSRASTSLERDLIQGLRDRQDWAYRELIDRWSERLYRLAYRFLQRREEAQEIVQEVLLKVMENVETFAGGSSLYTWLYRITVNQALMRIRSGKGRVHVSWDEILPKYEDGIRIGAAAQWAKLPDDLLAQKELEEFVGHCVEQLPEDERAAYVLKDLEGRSESEVCEILEITKPAMKNRVHRARLFLKGKIEERYVD